MTAEVDEIDELTDGDVSSESATFFNYVRMSRVRRPLGPTDEDVSNENVDSELIVHFTTVFRTWACYIWGVRLRPLPGPLPI